MNSFICQGTRPRGSSSQDIDMSLDLKKISGWFHANKVTVILQNLIHLVFFLNLLYLLPILIFWSIILHA